MTDSTKVPVAAAPAKSSAPSDQRPGVIGSIVRRPLAAVSLGWLGLVIGAVALAPVLAPYPWGDQDLASVLSGPTGSHLLGTDQLGRDVLSRLMFGGAPSMTGALIAVCVFLALGIPLGVLAGYFGGWFDRVVVLLAELLFATPGIIIMLVALAVFGNSAAIAMVTLGVLACGSLIRVLRASTLALREELYVRAARTSGLTEAQILRRHIVPRLQGPIIVQTSLFAGAAIIVETALGFLGFGAPPPSPSWGNMVGDASQAINTQPWLLVPTGCVIVFTVLAFGLLGDAVRDALGERWSTTLGAGAKIRNTAVTEMSASAKPADSAPDPAALLSVRDLTVTFPINGEQRNVVQHVNFDLRRGEVLGLVGESGCGKTVTSMAVLGLLRGGGRVSSGEAHFNGKNLITMSARERTQLRGTGIAFISQEPIASLDPAFTVGYQLGEVVRRHQDCSASEARERVVELLKMVQLRDPERVAKKYPHELSGGMAQRIGIAAALAGDPELLIADEPTTALDVTVQAEILDLLDNIRKRTGMGVIIVTHDFGVVADICDRAVVMYAGEVVENAPVPVLLSRPMMPYAAALLESSPGLVQSGQRLPAIPGSVPPPTAWPQGCHFQDRCTMVTDSCRAGSIPVLEVGPTHFAKCLFAEELRGRGTLALTRLSGSAETGEQARRGTSEVLLDIADLEVAYPGGRGHEAFYALKGVSLSVRSGTTLGLVGESGAGKSTIGNAVLGLAPVTGGRIVFDGRDISSVTKQERRALTRDIQVIFQDPYNSLNPARTVGQTLQEPLRLNLGMPEKEARSRIMELLDHVGLPASAADRYPSQFSGGQRQRIAIARALAVSPRLIVCDEAVSALDLSVQAQVLNLLTDLQDEYGLTYLFVSHDLEVVRHVADDIAVLRHGELQEYGDADQVYEAPSVAYTKELLAAAPVPDPAEQERRRTLRRELATASAGR